MSSTQTTLNTKKPILSHVNTSTEWDVLKNSDKVIVADFTATWCGPCQRIAPEYHKLAEKFQDNDNVVFTKIDVDENMEVSEECQIECMPTFQVWKGKQFKAKWEGASSEILTAIEKIISELLSDKKD